VDLAERTARHAAVSTTLALCSDEQLADLVDGAAGAGTGIGGGTSVLDLNGVPVFVKRIALTELERRPGNVMSTANVFGLPAHCHYGVGGPGFGAWRELAANVMTTNRVLAGRTRAFPLLHHWRVLPGAPAASGEHADVEGIVAFWGGSTAVRERLDAVAGAYTSVVLFLEYLPQTLEAWLTAQLALGDDAVDAACAMVTRQLTAAVGDLNAGGLVHFDAHFGNVLTDGGQLYLADLGLAASPRFALDAAEAAFVAHNATHDAAYAAMRLVNWLVTHVCGVGVPADGIPVERNAYVRECAAGADPVTAPPTVAAVIRRHAPVAAVMNDFYWELFAGRQDTPYPAAALAEIR
jgi:hypothetical protein